MRIPGLGMPIGLDAVIGLVPVVGDIVSMLISALLIREAALAGVGFKTLSKMAANVGLDAVVGMVPLLGDFFDITFRANRRNARLLRKAVANESSLQHG